MVGAAVPAVTDAFRNRTARAHPPGMTSEAEAPGGARAAVPVGTEVARLELVVREVGRSGCRVEHDVEVTRVTAAATVGDLVDAVMARLAPTGDALDRAVVIDGVPVALDRLRHRRAS